MCTRLNRVDLAESEVTYETIDTFLLDEWRNDMKKEIDSAKDLGDTALDPSSIEQACQLQNDASQSIDRDCICTHPYFVSAERHRHE